MKTQTFSRAVGLSIFSGLVSLFTFSGGALAYTFDATEASYDATYAATPIDLIGTVVDESQNPIRNVFVTAIAWGSGAGNDGLTARTDMNGTFVLPGLARRSVLLRIDYAGYYSEVVAADLHRPLSDTTADIPTVVLTRNRAGRARLVFGGDTMFGRRFVDADQDGIEGEPEDLIQPNTRADDAKALLAFLRDALSLGDYTVVNLESPVTNNPATPHPYKSYVFFSYPETIQALPYAGIDGVCLGNNHMYDFLELGIADTLSAVPNAGLDWFGAGMTEGTATGTVTYRTVGGGLNVAFQSFSQMVNDGTTDPLYTLVARDNPEKGGALEASTTNLVDFAATESFDHLAVPLVHGGIEYSDYPSSGMRSRFINLLQSGAGFVVAHHPHQAQGVALFDAGSGPQFVFMSLGNMIFDQDVFETFQSYLAVVDVDQLYPGAYNVHRVQLIPYHIEDYSPKMVTSDWLARTARHIGYLSTTLPAEPTPGAGADGLTGAVVFPAGNRIAVFNSTAGHSISQSSQTISLPITNLSTGAVAYPRTEAADMLASIQTNASVACQVGRDLAIYGDFEDDDVDDSFHEGSMWSQSTARYVQNSVVHSGIGAAVLLRNANSSTETSLFMNNRIKLSGGSSLTLTGFHKGDNAGSLQIQVYWYNSSGSILSSPIAYTRTAGTYDWESFSIPLTAPASAASFRAYFRAYPPASGEANTFLDDISLIEWLDSTPNASTSFNLPTPNNWSFFRCTTSSPALSSVNVTLTHQFYNLAPTNL